LSARRFDEVLGGCRVERDWEAHQGIRMPIAADTGAPIADPIVRAGALP
jgi:hypothetical protein